MKERIVLALGVYGYWVAIGDEVKYFSDRDNTRSYGSIDYSSANELVAYGKLIIIDDFTAPKWTVEDHLYFFLGEELYIEFWSECESSDFNIEISPKYRLVYTRDWGSTYKGTVFWHNKSTQWQKYCDEMGLGQGVICE